MNYKKISYTQLTRNQKCLVINFLSRLKSVRDVSEEFSLIQLNIPSLFFISATDKLRLALLLKASRFLPGANYFYSQRTQSYSLFFKFMAVYNNCFLYLINSSCLPIVEDNADKFSMIKRPFRDYSESYAHLKLLFTNNNEDFWFLKIEVVSTFNISYKSWLLRNFPLERKLLLVLLLNEYDNNTYLSKRLLTSQIDIYATFLLFTLNGLLCKSLLIIFNFCF